MRDAAVVVISALYTVVAIAFLWALWRRRRAARHTTTTTVSGPYHLPPGTMFKIGGQWCEVTSSTRHTITYRVLP